MRYFLEIAYKGTHYHGWQIQPNATTVQECVENAISILFRCSVKIVAAGRTDTGVHAKQMFVHFDGDLPFEKEVFIFKMNALLPEDISICNVFEVIDSAHARFDAEARTYQYQIYYGKNPFLIEQSWQLLSKKLDIKLMNEAAKLMRSYNNFKCFSKSNSDVKTYICDIKNAIWVKDEQLLVFHITADRFLRNMVRAIVGTLVEVGQGKCSLQKFQEIIESKDRSNAGASAPSQGLFLTEVVYPKNIFI